MRWIESAQLRKDIAELEADMYGECAPLTVFATEKLRENPFVQLPEHGYTPQYSREFVRTVEDVVDAFSGQCGDNPSFPNARFMIDYSAAQHETDRVRFLFAYGKSTEYPLPRRWKLPEYFTTGERFMARVFNSSLSKATLDGFGFIGSIGKNSDGEPDISMRGASENGPRLHTTVAELITGESDFFGAMDTLHPLRLRAGVRYNYSNGHIGNVFEPGNQSTIF